MQFYVLNKWSLQRGVSELHSTFYFTEDTQTPVSQCHVCFSRTLRTQLKSLIILHAPNGASLRSHFKSFHIN